MARITPRRTVAAIIIAAGILALLIPFLIHYPPSTGTTTPPPAGGSGGNGGSGSNGGGSSGGSGGGGKTPPADQTPPTTTISIKVTILNSACEDDEETFVVNATTVTLHATDDARLASIVLNDTGRVKSWNVTGESANVSLTLTVPGVHVLSYWSTDAAGNKETPHTTTVTVTVHDAEDHEHHKDDDGTDDSHVEKSNADDFHRENSNMTDVEHHESVHEHEKECRGDDGDDGSTARPRTLTPDNGFHQALSGLILTILQLMALLPAMPAVVLARRSRWTNLF